MSRKGSKLISDPPSQLHQISRYFVLKYPPFLCAQNFKRVAHKTTGGTLCLLWFGPHHYHNVVGKCLNKYLLQHWISRTGRDDKALLKWPSRSPDMTPYDFFLWGFIKDKILVPLLPRDLDELREWIRNEFVAVTRDMLVRIWTEMEYRLDISRVTKDTHIESL
ncbi:uncharacterized protein TNCV_1596661 [Trichonephila clavipes]|nr:uncharacterized protein TNCV_1596661 [Trichonephila clavipes]